MQGQRLLIQGYGATLLAQGTRNVPEVDQDEGLSRLILECLVKPEAFLVQLKGVLSIAAFKRRDAKIVKGVGHAPPVLEFLPERKGFPEQIRRPGEVGSVARDVPEGVERDGCRPVVVQEPAQTQTLLTQLLCSLVVALCAYYIAKHGDGGGGAGLVSEPAVRRKRSLQERYGPGHVSVSEGQHACPEQSFGSHTVLNPEVTARSFLQEIFGPVASLAEVTAHPPEPTQHPSQAQSRLDVASLLSPA